MFERKGTFLCAVMAALLLSFCAGKTQSSGSSESHFLKPCGAGCKGGFECVCGVCSAPCQADTACGDLGVPASVCVAGASGASCGESICDVLCDRDADCSAVGEGFACDAGRCRERVTCDDSKAALAALIDDSKACTSSTDCVSVSAPCYAEETCAAVVSLASNYDSAEFERRASAYATCVSPGGGCAACELMPPPPACVGGRCQLGGGEPNVTCSEREAEASRRVSTALEAAPLGCDTDADCTIIDTSSACHASCGGVLSLEGARQVQAVIDELDSGLCATFRSDGCQSFPPPCPFPGSAACIDGQCSAGFCGDGVCSSGESPATCPNDCF